MNDDGSTLPFLMPKRPVVPALDHADMENCNAGAKSNSPRNPVPALKHAAKLKRLNLAIPRRTVVLLLLPPN